MYNNVSLNVHYWIEHDMLLNSFYISLQFTVLFLLLFPKRRGFCVDTSDSFYIKFDERSLPERHCYAERAIRWALPRISSLFVAYKCFYYFEFCCIAMSVAKWPLCINKLIDRLTDRW